MGIGHIAYPLIIVGNQVAVGIIYIKWGALPGCTFQVLTAGERAGNYNA
jgi:hypothetical protein